MFFRFSARCSRDTVEMQGFELAAISVPPSDFHNFFEVATGHRRNAGNRAGGHFLSSLFSLFSAPSSLLSSALDSRNRIPAFLQGIMRPRGVLHCKNEAIRGGPGAKKTLLSVNLVISGGLFCDLFSLLSSLFSLQTRESANLVAVALLRFETA